MDRAGRRAAKPAEVATPQGPSRAKPVGDQPRQRGQVVHAGRVGQDARLDLRLRGVTAQGVVDLVRALDAAPAEPPGSRGYLGPLVPDDPPRGEPPRLVA